MLYMFAEYRVKERLRGEFLSWIGPIREKEGFRLLEGTDQPCLFVEIWEVDGQKELERHKRERAEGSAGRWARMDEFVEGGAAKAHLWSFREI